MFKVCFNIFIFNFLLPSLAFAAPIKVVIDEPIQLIKIKGGFKPSSDSRVTYIIGNQEFRPDGKIYQNGANTGQDWSLVTPDLVEKHYVYEKLAREQNTNVIVNLEVLRVDASDGSFSYRLDSSVAQDNLLSGYIISPKTGEESFIRNGLEYRSDGKVYKNGQATGETWGRPLTKSGTGSSLSEFLNGPGGALTAGVIVSVMEQYSKQNEWNQYVDSRRAEAKQMLKDSISANYDYAKSIDRKNHQIEMENKKAIYGLDSFFLNLNDNIYKEPLDITISDFNLQDPTQDVLKHIEYEFSKDTRDLLTEQVEAAANIKDYAKISRLIELSLNSKEGLLPELQDYTKDGRLFLPEKLNPSLGDSPLSGLDLNLDQSTQIGQTATRVANQLQTAWAVEKGLQGSSNKNILRHVTSLAMFQQALGTVVQSHIDALNYFKLSSLIMESGAGFHAGLAEAIEGTIKSIPILAKAGFNFAKNAMTQEGYLEDSFFTLLDNIPTITQAIWAQMIDSWDIIQNGSAYERSKLVGSLSLDVIIGFATGGSGAVAARGAKVAAATQKSLSAFKNLSNKAFGIKRSAAWLERQRPHLNKFEHWVDVADLDSINFHGPITGNLDKTHKVTDPLGSIPTVDGKIKFDHRGIPLPHQFVSNTFTGGTYMSYILKKPLRVYRVYNGDPRYRRGAFLLESLPDGPTQGIIDFALHPGFDNTATHWAILEIKAGTRIFEGSVAHQFDNVVLSKATGKLTSGSKNLMGGATQLYIADDPRSVLKVINYGSFSK
ncbi:MAG: hypothetical protein M9899_05710 [Bdellovibrionaceae bacterium]|nr:hypothetical protein [Pseudobdellovibrionaceae bacterium]